MLGFFKGRLLKNELQYSLGTRQKAAELAATDDWWGKHRIFIGEEQPEGDERTYSDLLASSIFCFTFRGEAQQHLCCSLPVGCACSSCERHCVCTQAMAGQAGSRTLFCTGAPQSGAVCTESGRGSARGGALPCSRGCLHATCSARRCLFAGASRSSLGRMASRWPSHPSWTWTPSACASTPRTSPKSPPFSRPCRQSASRSCSATSPKCGAGGC